LLYHLFKSTSKYTFSFIFFPILVAKKIAYDKHYSAYCFFQRSSLFFSRKYFTDFKYTMKKYTNHKWTSHWVFINKPIQFTKWNLKCLEISCVPQTYHKDPSPAVPKYQHDSCVGICHSLFNHFPSDDVGIVTGFFFFFSLLW
jgi:hypothetical protein